MGELHSYFVEYAPGDVRPYGLAPIDPALEQLERELGRHNA